MTYVVGGGVTVTCAEKEGKAEKDRERQKAVIRLDGRKQGGRRVKSNKLLT